MAPGASFLPNLAEVRPEVLQAMVRQPISHRSAEFHEMFENIQYGLRDVFGTERPVYVATASGTGMMEAAIRCSPRGRILSLVNGAFGERFVKIARACGREVYRHDVALGAVPDPGEVASLLERDSYAAVTVVHSETSTGALADLRAIASTAHDAGAAIIVDSVSGAGGTPLRVDDWSLDCVVSASQKAIGLPPGLGFAATSDHFLRQAAAVNDRGVYLDLVSFDAHARNSETPSTPSVALFFALNAEIAEIVRESIGPRWDRHEAMRVAMERWVASVARESGVGIGILATPGSRSPTVTALTLPPEIRSNALISAVAARGYSIGAGYGSLSESSVRIGHMAGHTVVELTDCLAAIG
ncbi:MAG TPA: aminotransferase class V-fold PLP-dependent enzyme, partial [Gemmatimonadaceae bacterium]